MVSLLRTRPSDRPVRSPQPERGSLAWPVDHARSSRLESLLLLELILVFLAVAVPGARADDAKATAAAPKGGSNAPAVAEPLQSINSVIDVLTNRLETLQKRRALPPKADIPPELAPLQGQIEALSKGTGAIVSLKTAVSVLDERVKALDAQVVELRKQLDAFKAGATKESEKPAAPPSGPAQEPDSPRTPRDRTTTPSITNPDLALALELFKVGKYQEASRLFQSLTDSESDDARVWYYAALCRGLTTQTWDGETLRLIQQGAEREKAGTPAKAEIDATLASIPVAKLKAWIDHNRKTAVR